MEEVCRRWFGVIVKLDSNNLTFTTVTVHVVHSCHAVHADLQ